MNKAIELAEDLDLLADIADGGRPKLKDDKRRIAASELRRLSAINAELLDALKKIKQKLRIDDQLDMYDSVCAAIAKAQGEQP